MQVQYMVKYLFNLLGIFQVDVVDVLVVVLCYVYSEQNLVKLVGQVCKMVCGCL